MVDTRNTSDIKARVRADQGERLRQAAAERHSGNLSAALREALDLAEKAETLRESAYEAWHGSEPDPDAGLGAYDVYVFLGGEARIRNQRGEILESLGPSPEELREYERLLRERGIWKDPTP